MTQETLTLDEIKKQLFAREPLPPLLPKKVWSAPLSQEISRLEIDNLVRAGLFVWNDDLAPAHAIAQAAEDVPNADYWHAILHRREGDFENAKYWYRRVGKHQVLLQLQKEFPGWEPSPFIDDCAETASSPDFAQQSREGIQAREMQLLMEACEIGIKNSGPTK